MTIFSAYKDMVYTAIARDENDAAALLVVPEAINYALDVAAILFKPLELFASEDVALTAGNTTVEFTTPFIDIVNIKDSTNNVILRFIPYESFDLLKPTLTTIKYYSLFGTSIHVNASVASDTTIAVEHIAYPATLSDDNDEPEFSDHDAFIISTATAFCFAVFEESEAVNIWGSVGEAFGGALVKAAQARELIGGRQTSAESAITGVLSQLASGT